MQWILLIIVATTSFDMNQSILFIFIIVLAVGLIGLSFRISKLTAIQKELLQRSDTLKKELQALKAVIPQQKPLSQREHIDQIVNRSQENSTLPVEMVETPSDTEIIPKPTPHEETPVLPTIEIIDPWTQNTPLSTSPLAACTITNENDSPAIEINTTPPIQPQQTTPIPERTTPSEPHELPKPSYHKIKKPDGFIDIIYEKARDWLTGGNTILKVGAIILFLGLAFLLRYATEGMSFPIEARYIAVAVIGCIFIGLGWRLREAVHNYGLILQGTGVGILYLTSYASMYLHQLLAPNTVFIFLLAFTVFAALLAIYQDSLNLAVAATLGGFAAPILVSSGGGNHVAFFSYLLLLNIGILSIAWFKAWRPLNIIGFVGTFGMGFAWGIKAYTPTLFWSTEPFLIIFYLLYVAIALLFARRKLYERKNAPNTRAHLISWSVKQTNYLDATLIFGTPIVAFGLQYTLVEHLTHGTAVTALVLGIFYLVQALVFHQLGSKRIALLMETNLALGVIFSTLAIPLAFDAEWTSASWALEAAGVFWISLKQQRRIGQFFSSFLLFAGSISYISQINLGNRTLLEGSSLGAILLIVSFSFCLFQALKHHETLKLPENILLSMFSILGCGFFYLLAPLNLMHQETAICWTLMGLVTLVIGYRAKLSTLFRCGLFIQCLAIILFINQLSFQQLGVGFNTNPYLFILCFLFGSVLIANTYFIINTKQLPIIINNLLPLKILLLAGLVIVNLSLLFVLPWLWVACLWAIIGCLIIKQAKRFNHVLPFYVGLALLFAAIINFLSHNTLQTPTDHFFNIDFITALTVSISALIMAWQIQRPFISTLSKSTLQTISRILLVIGIIGWGLAFITEINAIISIPYQNTVYLLMAVISISTAGLAAKQAQWQDLSLTQLLLIPIAAIILNQNFFYPLSHFGWLVWPIVIAAHFFNLEHLEKLIPRKGILFCHTVGLWLIIIVLSCFLSQLLEVIAIANTTGSWLAWMVVPSLWLLLCCYRSELPWPVKVFERAYRYNASLPIAAYVFAWYWLANTYSTGSISIIPYIPILNPLELGLIMALISSISWLSRYQQYLPITLPEYFTKSLLGISLFAMSTAVVFRTAFHWLGVPFHFADQIHSMSVQASLSILWTFIALGLMIRGYQKAYRELWLVGAALIVLVVIKLFFVELSNSGSLARIVSFTIVGLLLLIVGYFAPLPPKKAEKEITD